MILTHALSPLCNQTSIQVTIFSQNMGIYYVNYAVVGAILL